jgi:hypothetical protein
MLDSDGTLLFTNELDPIADAWSTVRGLRPSAHVVDDALIRIAQDRGRQLSDAERRATRERTHSG